MKSVLLTIVVLPLLQPIWEKAPFDSKNMAVPTAPTFLTNQQIQEQKKYFSKLSDPRLKSKIIASLAEAGNPYAVSTLETMLRNEENNLVLADILKSIYAYKGKVKIGKHATIKQYLKHEAPTVRSLAAALYLHKTKDVNTLLRMLDKEKSPYVSNFLTKEIAELADQATVSEALLKKLALTTIPASKGNGLYLLARFSKMPGKSVPLNKSITMKDDFIRASIARGLAERKQGGEPLLMKLSDDSNSTIRAITASATTTPAREGLFLKLANDKDWEVRRVACNSLANYKDTKAVNALLTACQDPVNAVREAAENALITITPGPEARQKLIAMLANKVGRNSAIKILGAIKEKKAAEKIFNILKTSKKAKTQARAITALAQLGYNAAWQTASKYAKSRFSKTRCAVVHALAEFAEKGSFDTLIKLSKDKDSEVALKAVTAMGKLASPHFNKRLLQIISNVSSNSKPEMRAAAGWALAKINEPTDPIVKQLKKLCLKKVIKVEGMTMYDSDYVRMAACMALIDFAKKNEAFKGTAKTVVKRLKEPPLMDPEFNTESLRAFAKQAFLYMKGQKATAKEVEPSTPILTVTKTKKAKKSYRPSANPTIVR